MNQFLSFRENIMERNDYAHRQLFNHSLFGPDQFRERLVSFWFDHFTVSGEKSFFYYHAIPGFIAEAIRPNVASSFSDLLIAATLHPAMMVFLDGYGSTGPQSLGGWILGRGLNENLAREIFELHTLGVRGSYSQRDVEQAAKLLTGFYNAEIETGYTWLLSEPGARTIMGRRYEKGFFGSDETVRSFLRDLSVHPHTANHISKKLVVHFVTDSPTKAMEDAVAQAYRDTDGDLASVYSALLALPQSRSTTRHKIKQPYDYVVSGFRALGVKSKELQARSADDFRKYCRRALIPMGQRFLKSPGPDGMPEDPQSWITPPQLAGRAKWALEVASEFGGECDAERVLETALPEGPDEPLRRSLDKITDNRTKIALILSSTQFNRR